MTELSHGKHYRSVHDNIQDAIYRADSRFAPSQWETALLCNDVSHWLGANLESALNAHLFPIITDYIHKQQCRCLSGKPFPCTLHAQRKDLPLSYATYKMGELLAIGLVFLTHLTLDKMATIVADDNFKCIFLNENNKIPIRFSLKFFWSPIDNKPALVQVTAWRRTGDKPLPEPILTQYTDIYAALWGDELKECII